MRIRLVALVLRVWCEGRSSCLQHAVLNWREQYMCGMQVKCCQLQQNTLTVRPNAVHHKCTRGKTFPPCCTFNSKGFCLFIHNALLIISFHEWQNNGTTFYVQNYYSKFQKLKKKQEHWTKTFMIGWTHTGTAVPRRCRHMKWQHVSSVAQWARTRTHQFLCLRAEEGIDANDEGGGGAQDL